MRPATLILCGVLNVACFQTKAAPPPPLAVRLAETGFGIPLAAEYKQVMPNLDAQVVAGRNVLSLLEERQADVTMTMADLAYFSHRRSLGKMTSQSSLRAIAALEVLPLHLVVRGDVPARDLAGLRGRSIAVTRELAGLVLKEAGLADSRTHVRPFEPGAATLLATGTLDAFMVPTPYPSDTIEPAIRQGARLVPLDGPLVERLQRTYPFIRLARIPAGTYPRQTENIHTIGVNMVYVCRANLDEALVYELTRGLFRALPALSKRVPSWQRVNVERASIVPIPLHEGAARYYRELELQ